MGAVTQLSPLGMPGPAYGSGPTLTACTPSSGPTAGGTAVTLTGSGLADATGVTFDGDPATDVTAVDDQTVTCKTPAHATGAVYVVVSTPDGDGTLTSGFTYQRAGGVVAVMAAWAGSRR